MNAEKKIKLVFKTVRRLLDPSVGIVQPRDYQLLFQDVHVLCQAVPESHFEELSVKLEQFLSKQCRKVCKKLNESANLLADFRQCFEDYNRGSTYAHEAFRTFNSQVKQQAGDDSISITFDEPDKQQYFMLKPLAMKKWQEHVFAPLVANLQRLVLEEIRKDRDGEPADLYPVQGVLESTLLMCEHDTDPSSEYISRFETPVLQATTEYYKRESSHFLMEHDCTSYLVKADQRIQEEDLRCKKTCQALTFDKMKATVEKAMVTDHSDILVQESQNYIMAKQLPNLRKLHDLLKPIEGPLIPIRDAFHDYVKARGSERMNALIDAKEVTPVTFASTMIELYNEFEEMVRDGFDNNPLFSAALDKACRSVANMPTSSKIKGIMSAAELLARYADSILKKSSKHDDDEALDAKLGRTILIFQYLDDKDVFQKFYSRMLAKRLIYRTSASEEGEESMISRLKEACGYDYTSKLHRMFQDVTLSNDLSQKFSETDKGSSISFNLKLLILRTGAWPIGAGNQSDFALPPSFQSALSGFEMYYNNQHSGRKLNWLHSYGTVDIKARFGKRTFDFHGSTFQAGVLMLFNSTDSLSLGEIAEKSLLNEKELDRTVTSLKLCNLVKYSTEALEPDTIVSINTKYSNKRKKVKILAALPKETQAESRATQKSVDEDRRLFLQAVSVRIMKTRKSLTYALLIQEIIDQSKARFKPSVPSIKKCIEELIEKGYMARQENDRSTLNYIA